MMAVILAGGLGTRLSEETKDKPKPMVRIGNMPILWHIMKIYSTYGINNIIICCGYKQEIIKEYFSTEFKISKPIIEQKSFTKIVVEQEKTEPWTITLVDTGLDTMTGGRLKRIKELIHDEIFCFTYGDTLNDLNILKLIDFHKKSETLVTVTACKPPGKFGILEIKDERVLEFREKPKGDGNWVNGGFFVLNKSVFDYIKEDSTVWEEEPLQKLVKTNQVSAYKHDGFYQPMDTIYEKKRLEEMWISNNAKWKVWK